MRGLIVFQEAFGVNEHIQEIKLRFAEQGYLAIAPELFHRTAPPGFVGPYNDFSKVASHYSVVTEDTTNQDARACFDRLMQQKSIGGVMAIGYCMGGRTDSLAMRVPATTELLPKRHWH